MDEQTKQAFKDLAKCLEIAYYDHDMHMIDSLITYTERLAKGDDETVVKELNDLRINLEKQRS